MKTILILNGPNLNLLGLRQPEIYGEVGLDELKFKLKEQYKKHKLIFFQSNHEGDLIDQLHNYGFDIDGIVFNAGAYAHTSIALADAIRSRKTPVIEVHISDIENREDFRKHSYLTEACIWTITGEGIQGYFKAIDLFLSDISKRPE